MDDNNNSCVYGLRHQARCVAPVLGSTDRNIFLLGTVGVTGDNEVHLLEYDDDQNQIYNASFPHPNEIWSISAVPNHRDLFFTCYSVATPVKQDMRSALWKITGDDWSNLRSKKNANNSQLEPIMTLDSKHTEGAISNLLLDPNSEPNKIVAVDNSNLHIYSLSQGLSKAMLGNTIKVPKTKSYEKISSGSWNVHSSSQVGVTIERDVRFYDIRTMSESHHISNAHGIQTRCLDFNPNKPYQVVTGGDDCKIKFWDIRNPSTHTLELKQHTHWVYCVLFNPFHDQLVLSSSSDCQVNLNNIFSISSANHHDENSTEDIDSNKENVSPKTTQSDGLVSVFDQHEDSVYSCAWSPADPWVFLSLSYDGRAVVNNVPRDEKYKILL